MEFLRKLLRLSFQVDFLSSVDDETETTKWSPVMSDLKHRRCMSGILLLLVINWMMRRTVEGVRTEIRRNFTAIPENLDILD
ncbi:hypothetical protein DPMN_007965 [Dreissena polymorpha]|uniref:Uncharacterized protein n=1 Tax=Dreissena polymorpha TaxID=45954 RepID=A0A9D4RYQ3_DREPO|nr:hypothetical protein DPMN_007965 [Dreissena polymorpha]